MVRTRKEQLSVANSTPGDVLEVDGTGSVLIFANSAFDDEIRFTIAGIYSGSATPGFFDPPYPMRTDGYITEVVLMRRTAGTAGSTTIDVLINGNSIFDTQTKPSINFSEGDNVIDVKSSFDAGESEFVQNDFIDVELESAESGAAEGLIVLVRIVRT